MRHVGERGVRRTGGRAETCRLGNGRESGWSKSPAPRGERTRLTGLHIYPQIDAMRLLTTPAALEKAFKELLTRHGKLSFAVAWASHDFPAYDELLKQQHKIQQGIVGIHFYQTHPDFIEHFLDDERIGFVKKSSGVFHPKFYLFENPATGWSCIIGSANFTAAAFSTNAEACLLFENSDDPDGRLKRQLDRALATYWEMTDCFEPAELEQYRDLWKLFRDRRKGMAGDFDNKGGPGKPPLATPLLKLSWKEYYQKVLRDRYHGIDGRIALLGTAKQLFETRQSLSRMSKFERQGIGGFAPKGEMDWGWFGSMFGAGVFKKIINANSTRLSKALDIIPSRGEVRRDEYMAYIDDYIGAYPGEKRHGLATATRLLAMKRPDYFVCFDGENRDGLCKAFGIALRHHDYERYWDSIVERILISKWWTSPRPLGAQARAIWDGRAAFLDSLFYKPRRKT
jgi:hypothetical protein